MIPLIAFLGFGLFDRYFLVVWHWTTCSLVQYWLFNLRYRPWLSGNRNI